MAIKMNQMDEAKEVVSAKSKTFLSKHEKLQKGEEATLYMLAKTVDEIEAEFVHKMRVTTDKGFYFANVICNSGFDKDAECVGCQNGSFDEGTHKQIVCVAQFFDPETNTTYVQDIGSKAIKKLSEKLARKSKKGVSVLQIPIIVSKDRTYEYDPDDADDSINPAVEAAYEDRHESTELYKSWTNDMYREYLETGKEPTAATEDTNSEDVF